MKRGYVRLALRIVLLAAVGYVLFAHVILITQASGNGMFPAVKDGDLIVAFRLQSDTCWAITARRRRTAELSALFRWNTWKGRPLPLSVDGVCNPPPRKSMTEAKKEEKKEAAMKIAKRVIPLIAAFALALCMGAVAFAAEQTAAFTNTKDGEIDMGVVLDSLPYVVTLAVVVLGAVALVARKRRASK